MTVDTAIEQQAKEFREQGYLIAGQALTSEELEQLRSAYDRIFQSNDKPSSYRNLGQTEDGLSKGAVLQIINLYEHDDAFKRILFKPELLTLAQGLIGSSSVRLYHDQGLYKPALHGDEVPWHQDNGYWKLQPATAVSCWIALDDATIDNGCMWVVPTSHRSGEVGHQRAGQYVAQIKADADESLAVPIPLPAGHAMFHHCLTLHRTLPNISPHQRRAWVIHYMDGETVQNGTVLNDRLLLKG